MLRCGDIELNPGPELRYDYFFKVSVMYKTTYALIILLVGSLCEIKMPDSCSDFFLQTTGLRLKVPLFLQIFYWPSYPTRKPIRVLLKDVIFGYRY